MSCTSCKTLNQKCKSRERRIRDLLNKLATLYTLTGDEEYKEIRDELEDSAKRNGYCQSYTTIRELTNFVEYEYHKYS